MKRAGSRTRFVARRLCVIALLITMAAVPFGIDQLTKAAFASRPAPANGTASIGTEGVSVFVSPARNNTPTIVSEIVGSHPLGVSWTPAILEAVLVLGLLAALAVALVALETYDLENGNVLIALALILGSAASEAHDLMEHGSTLGWLAVAINGRLRVTLNLADLFLWGGCFFLVVLLATTVLGALMEALFDRLDQANGLMRRAGRRILRRG